MKSTSPTDIQPIEDMLRRTSISDVGEHARHGADIRQSFVRAPRPLRCGGVGR